VIVRVHLASFIAVMMTGAVVGCGSSGTHSSSTTTVRHARRAPAQSVPALPALPHGGTGQPTVPTPGPTGIRPSAAAVAVIRGWSDALRRGDVRSAAGYFSLPSVMVNGTDFSGGAVVIPIGTRAEAEAANVSLPCGATFLSADQRGRYINALFRLTGRPGLGGSTCGTGVGQTARTNFEIIDGRIVEWIRAPDDPGDNNTPAVPAQPQPSPSPSPSSPAPAGPTV
jgi:hypothetical protein